MSFNSFPFLFIFLPATLGIFYLVSRSQRLKLVLGALSLLSLVFYAYGDWHLLYFFVPAVLGNYLVGLLLQKRPTRVFLAFGVGLNNVR